MWITLWRHNANLWKTLEKFFFLHAGALSPIQSLCGKSGSGGQAKLKRFFGGLAGSEDDAIVFEIY
jgi:hypothetical protein